VGGHCIKGIEANFYDDVYTFFYSFLPPFYRPMYVLSVKLCWIMLRDLRAAAFTSNDDVYTFCSCPETVIL
jgi:hypothetical protein